MAIFQKKNPATPPVSGSPVLRGRDDADNHSSASNPLAKRFVTDDEPDTIDLGGGAGFPAEGEIPAEPETRAAQAVESAVVEDAPADRFAFLTLDPATGKLYVQPGTPASPVLLGGEPVRAATELRRGDLIRVGDSEFQFLL